MVILRMNNSICEGQGRIFISIEFAIRSVDIPGVRGISNQGSYKIIDSRLLLNISRSEHAGMTSVCSVGRVRLDL